MGEVEVETVDIKGMDDYQLADFMNKNAIYIKTSKTRSGLERKSYGRYVADVFFDEQENRVNLSELLIKDGFDKDKEKDDAEVS